MLYLLYHKPSVETKFSHDTASGSPSTWPSAAGAGLVPSQVIPMKKWLKKTQNGRPKITKNSKHPNIHNYLGYPHVNRCPCQINHQEIPTGHHRCAVSFSLLLRAVALNKFSSCAWIWSGCIHQHQSTLVILSGLSDVFYQTKIHYIHIYIYLTSVNTLWLQNDEVQLHSDQDPIAMRLSFHRR